MSRATTRALLLLATVTCLAAVPAPARAALGIAGFQVAANRADGSPEVRAGAHPYALKAGVSLATESGGQRLRDLTISLPPGLLINSNTVTECSSAAFRTPRSSTKPGSLSGESCPNSSQVGVVEVEVAGVSRWFGLFNLAPPSGAVAALGTAPFGTALVFTVQLREDDYGLDLRLQGLPQAFALSSLQLTIWGTPWWGDAHPSETHDPQRGDCLNEETGGSLASSCQVLGPGLPQPDGNVKSLLTMPTTPCGSAPLFSVSAGAWSGSTASALAAIPPLSACNRALTSAKVQLMTAAAAARTGLAFNLDVNDGGGITNPGGIARPALKTALVSLPTGLTINPSVGAGLGVCSEADFARETATSEPGSGCPNASKIGTVRLEGAIGQVEPLTGSVYLAAPRANPFGSLFAVYMLARNPRRGLIVKSLGLLEPNLGSGAIEARFEDLPRLLYTHFSLNLREGQRSVLISPPLCGSYPATLALASWAEPLVFRSEATSFAINSGEGGGACPGGGAPPFHPAVTAGSINPQAGAYTPFYLRLARSDGEGEITAYSATLPPGLLGSIAGITTCSDAAIAAARQASGSSQAQSPSCPASSLIGHTVAGFGVGGALAYASGQLYLAGPYHGAPLSIVAIDPALVGPFDLGTVVARQAVRIDPRTAQVSLDAAGSDPIPHLLAGIPLDLRDIRVAVDRDHFMVNPTSCDPMQVSSTLAGAGADPFSAADDVSASSSQRYQLLGCADLGFAPQLSLRLGASRHGAFPALNAVYEAPPGGANVSSVAVTLPPSLFLEQAHIKDVCTRPQFAAGACPPSSIYGDASATTPLLEAPLTGPVYLRSSSNTVPDLVASLRGRGIAIEVVGRIDQAHGGVRARFEGLPDAPASKFTMSLFGGRRGLLVNSEPACGKTHRALARFIGQNNATATGRPPVTARCGGHRAGKKHGHRKRHRDEGAQHK